MFEKERESVTRRGFFVVLPMYPYDPYLVHLFAHQFVVYSLPAYSFVRLTHQSADLRTPLVAFNAEINDCVNYTETLIERYRCCLFCYCFFTYFLSRRLLITSISDDFQSSFGMQLRGKQTQLYCICKADL